MNLNLKLILKITSVCISKILDKRKYKTIPQKWICFHRKNFINLSEYESMFLNFNFPLFYQIYFYLEIKRTFN